MTGSELLDQAVDSEKSRVAPPHSPSWELTAELISRMLPLLKSQGGFN